jgi:hypothetical protein
VRRDLPLMASAAALAFACGDGGIGPTDDQGSRLATQFERLADSVDAGGYSPTAEALRHAAEIVRLTGHATPVTLTVDDSPRNFLAVAEQIDFPNLVCSWPSDSGIVSPPDSDSIPVPDTVGMPPVDSTGVVPSDTVQIPVDSGVVLPPPEPPECQAVGTYSMRTLIAWEPEHMAEVVRIVAYIGSSQAAPGVPDVMIGLPSQTVAADPRPTATPPDSGSGSGGEPGGFPGFMGEYLVRDVGSWWAVEGAQTNDLEGATGACTDDRATFDWAEFSCEETRFSFEVSMRLEPLPYVPLMEPSPTRTPVEGSHTVALASSSVDGVRLTWESWTPPPEPGPDPLPIDTTSS